MIRGLGTRENHPLLYSFTVFTPSPLLRVPTTARFTLFRSNQGNGKMIAITPRRKGSEYAKHDVHDQQDFPKHE
jgi:hypothetical protein